MPFIHAARRSLIVPKRPAIVAAAPFAAAFVAGSYSEDTSDLSEYTFSTQPIGTAASGRRPIFVIHAEANGAADRTVSSVVVNGSVSCTLYGLTSRNPAYIAVPVSDIESGTTASVVVTISDECVNCMVSTVRAVNFTSVLDTDDASGTADTSHAQAVDVQNGGFVVSAWSSNAAVATETSIANGSVEYQEDAQPGGTGGALGTESISSDASDRDYTWSWTTSARVAVQTVSLI